MATELPEAMATDKDQTGRKVNPRLSTKAQVAIAVMVLAVPIIWLLVCGMLVDIEYFDGLDAICNTLYFTGDSSHFLWNRSPGISLLLIPARLMARSLGMAPGDVRPYHLEMALIHAGMLVTVFLLLRRRAENTLIAAAAIVVTVLVFIFYSYGLFLSHDLLPGILFLGMLFLVDRFADKPAIGAWSGLLTLGAFAAAIKPTLGVIWAAILAAGMMLVITSRWRGQPGISWQRWLLLLAGAVTSAVIYWIICGWALAGASPEVSFWMRPWHQVSALRNSHHAMPPPPFWFYLRNLPAYGWGMVVLILPGIALSLRRGDRLSRWAAWSWIIAFFCMWILPFQEVRYLAFLMPVSALVILPAITWLAHFRYGIAVLVLLCLVDQTVALREAARVRYPFYRQSQLTAFLAPLEAEKPELFILGDVISVVPPIRSPLAGDPNHRIFSLDAYHLHILANRPVDAVRTTNPETIAQSLASPQSAALILPGTPLRNQPGWHGGVLSGWPEHQLLGFLPATLPIKPIPGGVQTADGTLWELMADQTTSNKVILNAPGAYRWLSTYACPSLVDRETQRAYRLVNHGGEQLELLGLEMYPDSPDPERWIFRGYRATVQARPDAADRGLEVEVYEPTAERK